MNTVIEKNKNLIKKIAGLFLILLGLLGLLVPIMPGWIFIFIGLELIGINLFFFGKIKEYIKNKIDEEKLKKGKAE